MRWGTAGRIGVGWLLTLPASAVVGGLAAWAASLGPVGIAVDAVLGAGVIATIFVLSSRNRVSSSDAVGEKAAPAVAGVSEVAQSGQVVRIEKVKPLKRSRTRRKRRAKERRAQEGEKA